MTTNQKKQELLDLAQSHILECLNGKHYDDKLVQVAMQTWNNLNKEVANEAKQNALRYAVATSMYVTSKELKKILPKVLPEYSAQNLIEA